MRKITKLSMVAISALMLGCGVDNDNNEEISKAVIEDSVISGLDYVTDTGLNGVTDNKGEFEYKLKDKSVTFKLGDMIIGTFDLNKLQSDKRVLVGEVLGLDRNNNTDPKLIELLRFLQSADSNGNLDDGIQISNDFKSAVSSYLRDGVNRNLLENNSSLLEEMVESQGKKFISEREAREHYAKTIKAIGLNPTFKPFEIVVDIPEDDNNLTIFVNNNDYPGEYNYTVDWGDGTVDKYVSGNISHIYDVNATLSSDEKSGLFVVTPVDPSQIAEYHIKIIGQFPQFSAVDNMGKYLKTVTSWGDIHWKSFNKTFYFATKLSNFEATDTPDLTEVIDMGHMFEGSSFNGDLKDWNLTNIRYMNSMFENDRVFNQPINDWDVSNVVNMNSMFRFASAFNQPLNEWNTSKVIDMSAMFYGTELFNQSLNDWDVSNVTDMSYMFGSTISFNQPLDKWNMSNVKNVDYMFINAEAFNGRVNGWNLCKVKTLNHLFEGALLFNQPIKDWNVTNIIEMNSTFNTASSFNQELNDWDVSNVKSMDRMFYDASNFNQPLNDWDVSNLEYMDYMFKGATSFSNQDLSGWDVSKVVQYTDFNVSTGVGNIWPNFN